MKSLLFSLSIIGFTQSPLAYSSDSEAIRTLSYSEIAQGYAQIAHRCPGEYKYLQDQLKDSNVRLANFSHALDSYSAEEKEFSAGDLLSTQEFSMSAIKYPFRSVLSMGEAPSEAPKTMATLVMKRNSVVTGMTDDAAIRVDFVCELKDSEGNKIETQDLEKSTQEKLNQCESELEALKQDSLKKPEENHAGRVQIILCPDGVYRYSKCPETQENKSPSVIDLGSFWR